jgi:uncharacterized Zn-finger protein
MPHEQINPADDSIEALCNYCGRTFSVFLHQMQAQNSKVVCPLCEKENDCTPPKAGGTAQKH